MTGSEPAVKFTVQVSWPVPLTVDMHSTVGTQETLDPRTGRLSTRWKLCSSALSSSCNVYAPCGKELPSSSIPSGSYMWIVKSSSTVAVSVGSGNASGHVFCGGSVDRIRYTSLPPAWVTR